MRSRGSILSVCSLALAVVFLALITTSRADDSAPLCLATGKACGIQGVPDNDRPCCPGLVCGWGNTCFAGCRINGAFYQPGVKNPRNPCEVCVPALSTSAWSPLSYGSCNDGSQCTRNDACVYGRCVGQPITCDDYNACTQDACYPTTGCVYKPKNCDDYDPCTRDYCNPGNGCCVHRDCCD